MGDVVWDGGIVGIGIRQDRWGGERDCGVLLGQGVVCWLVCGLVDLYELSELGDKGLSGCCSCEDGSEDCVAVWDIGGGGWVKGGEGWVWCFRIFLGFFVPDEEKGQVGAFQEGNEGSGYSLVVM